MIVATTIVAALRLYQYQKLFFHSPSRSQS